MTSTTQQRWRRQGLHQRQLSRKRQRMQAEPLRAKTIAHSKQEMVEWEGRQSLASPSPSVAAEQAPVSRRRHHSAAERHPEGKGQAEQRLAAAQAQQRQAVATHEAATARATAEMERACVPVSARARRAAVDGAADAHPRHRSQSRGRSSGFGSAIESPAVVGGCCGCYDGDSAGVFLLTTYRGAAATLETDGCACFRHCIRSSTNPRRSGCATARARFQQQRAVAQRYHYYRARQRSDSASPLKAV